MCWQRLGSFRMLLLSALLALTACPPPPTHNWRGESAVGYKVGTGDVLKVNVWKHEEVTSQVSVRPDGMITVPLVGDVAAKGRTASEIAADLTTRLRQFYSDPSVAVQVVEVKSYKVYVLGEVSHSGEFAPNGEMTVIQVLALAGGFTKFADPSRIVILRRDASGERRIPIDYTAVVDKGDIQQNLTLQSGDTVIVP